VTKRLSLCCWLDESVHDREIVVAPAFTPVTVFAPTVAIVLSPGFNVRPVAPAGVLITSVVPTGTVTLCCVPPGTGVYPDAFVVASHGCDAGETA
jgi:hypothetical protein